MHDQLEETVLASSYPQSFESELAGTSTEGNDKRKNRKRPTYDKLQQTAIDLEQEIKLKRLEVVDQELENTCS